MATYISFTIDDNQNGHDNTLDAVEHLSRIRRMCFLFLTSIDVALASSFPSVVMRITNPRLFALFPEKRRSLELGKLEW